MHGPLNQLICSVHNSNTIFHIINPKIFMSMLYSRPESNLLQQKLHENILKLHQVYQNQPLKKKKKKEKSN